MCYGRWLIANRNEESSHTGKGNECTAAAYFKERSDKAAVRVLQVVSNRAIRSMSRAVLM